MIRSFELEGAEVAYLFTVQMGGTIVEQINGSVYTNGLSCLIECKDQAGNVNIDPIAKLRNQLLRRPLAVCGILFSTSGFTEATEILTQYSTQPAIMLRNGADLNYGCNINACGIDWSERTQPVAIAFLSSRWQQPDRKLR